MGMAAPGSASPHAAPARPRRLSAGVLLFRRPGARLEVLLVHPGGPYWTRRDVGAWQLPKGQVEPGEAIEAAARREVAEELGVRLGGPLVPLGRIRQSGGKMVEAFAAEQDLDPSAIVSTDFALEWPPRSGRIAHFPEVDAARWLSLEAADAVILPSQRPVLTMLREVLAA